MNRPKAERVLITGGAGFIGYRTARLLLRRGVQVAVFDNLASGLPMPAAEPGLFPYQADIRDVAALTAAFDAFKPDAVLHLAAVHHIPTVERQRDYAHDVDIIGTERVLAQCERTNVGFFILASSAAVYAPVEGKLAEDTTPLQAIDNYSLCKLSNEHQVRFWTERTGAVVRIGRIFNTVGHDDPTGHLLPDILKQIGIQQKNATIQLGNTTPRRDYVHADDTAAAFVGLLTESTVDAPVEAFNICRGEEYSVLDLVAAISELSGIAINWVSDPTRIRLVDRQSILGSIDKMRRRISWRPQHDFRDNRAENFAGPQFPDIGECVRGAMVMVELAKVLPLLAGYPFAGMVLDAGCLN